MGWQEPREVQLSSNKHSPAEGMQLYPPLPPPNPIERGCQAGSEASVDHCPACFIADNTSLMCFFPALERAWAWCRG